MEFRGRIVELVLHRREKEQCDPEEHVSMVLNNLWAVLELGMIYINLKGFLIGFGMCWSSTEQKVGNDLVTRNLDRVWSSTGSTLEMGKTFE